ncbi:MAG: thioesterase [Synechococcaceae cyanobacterium SM2_3_1]|nr:thioesterase [Synechococcaceae cyanobacterium SM2_3_1]
MSMVTPHTLAVQIYYEDTDFSGFVYHANYLRYFERSREHLLGIEDLVTLYHTYGIGFVVYRIEANYRRPAVHGDKLEVRSYAWMESPLRAAFLQSVWRGEETKPLVEALIQVACIDRSKRPIPVPNHILPTIHAYSPEIRPQHLK